MKRRLNVSFIMPGVMHSSVFETVGACLPEVILGNVCRLIFQMPYGNKLLHEFAGRTFPAGHRCRSGPIAAASAPLHFRHCTLPGTPPVEIRRRPHAG